jgi:hypothetical protein
VLELSASHVRQNCNVQCLLEKVAEVQIAMESCLSIPIIQLYLKLFFINVHHRLPSKKRSFLVRATSLSPFTACRGRIVCKGFSGTDTPDIFSKEKITFPALLRDK